MILATTVRRLIETSTCRSWCVAEIEIAVGDEMLLVASPKRLTPCERVGPGYIAAAACGIFLSRPSRQRGDACRSPRASKRGRSWACIATDAPIAAGLGSGSRHASTRVSLASQTAPWHSATPAACVCASDPPPTLRSEGRPCEDRPQF